MKKFGFCLLALCLVGYVAGCGNKEDTTDPTPNTTTNEEGTTTDPADPADPAEPADGTAE